MKSLLWKPQKEKHCSIRARSLLYKRDMKTVRPRVVHNMSLPRIFVPANSMLTDMHSYGGTADSRSGEADVERISIFSRYPLVALSKEPCVLVNYAGELCPL